MATSETIELSLSQILYEDEWIIAVSKPAGLPSQGTRDPRRDHLIAALERLLTTRDGRAPYLGLHHRLDRDTSGVIILARAKQANKGLTDVFRDRLAKKTYRALCRQDPQRWSSVTPGEWSPGMSWQVDNYLATARGTTTGRQQSVRSGGERAQTDFVLLETRLDWAEVEARPKTGRTHQIRVHLAEGGLPIVGDTLYGGTAFAAGHKVWRVMLHALCIELPHPVTGKDLVIESPLPEDYLELAERLGLGASPIR
jgi:RluA family pseudouridine synthase